MLEQLRSGGHQIINIDVRAPRTAHKNGEMWHQCSLLDRETLAGIFREAQPSHVVHLAAYASMEARTLDEFSANIEGTANLIAAIKGVSSVKRVIITSTQHVRKPGSGMPSSDTDYIPYMLYGESKVLTERITREAGLECGWTIIRPTAVWGPGQLLLAEGLWRLMARGRYIHPANDPVIRSYGYVKNVVWQIQGLLEATRDRVDRKVFYVADGNGSQLDWVNAVSRELTGHNVRTVPLALVKGLSKIGDGLRALGLSFPIYRDRLENLITHNPVPTEPILDLLGPSPYSMATGAQETATWLKSYYEAGRQ